MENRKVIVIGAGIGGLSAAYWLRQRAYEVEILEATERPAGRMVTLERKGDRVDVGAQFYYSNCPHVVGMVERVGLTASQRRILHMRSASSVQAAPSSTQATPSGPRRW
jgi:protoporphyrinogen oxidase